MATYPNDQGNPAGAIPVYIAPPSGAAAANISTNTSVQVATGAGFVSGISVNTAGTGSTLKLYDGTSASGILLGTWNTAAINQWNVAIPYATGLFAVTAGSAAADVTITYA